MGDAAPVFRRGEILQTQHLGSAKHIPQTEIDAQAAIGLGGDLAGDEALCADHAPIGEVGRHVDIADRLDEGFGIERLEEAGAFEIGAHDAGDIGAGLRIGLLLGDEIGDRDGQRFHIAARNVHLQRRHRRRCRQRQDNRRECRNQTLHLISPIYPPPIIWRGSKCNGSISRH